MSYTDIWKTWRGDDSRKGSHSFRKIVHETIITLEMPIDPYLNIVSLQLINREVHPRSGRAH